MFNYAHYTALLSCIMPCMFYLHINSRSVESIILPFLATAEIIIAQISVNINIWSESKIQNRDNIMMKFMT